MDDIMSMKRTYTETYDVNTEVGAPTLLGFHTPIGEMPRQFLEPCFRMYKKYKYVGCDVTVVNSARLPIDPEQVGKVEGTNYVDPRDSLNPILFKGCHGESLGKILDSMYGGLASSIFKNTSIDKEQFMDDLTNFYYTALGDDTWRKSPVQKTLRISNLHPLVYGLSTQHQIAPTNLFSYAYYSMNDPDVVTGTGSGQENGQVGVPNASLYSPEVMPTQVYDPTTGEYQNLQQLLSFFTNKTQRLGWMDTLQFIGSQTQNTNGYVNAQVAELPKIFMGLLMLPPAYLCRQYLRIIVRHRFVFSQYRSITTGGSSNENYDFVSDAYGYHERYTGNTATTTSTSKASVSAQLSSPSATFDDSEAEVEPDESE